MLLAVAFGLMVWGFQTLLFSHAPMVFNDAFEDMSEPFIEPRRDALVVCALGSAHGNQIAA